MWAAASVTELHRMLITQPFLRRSTQHREAIGLFARHHGDNLAGAVDTAVLLCTAWRWSRCTDKVIDGICGTGILDEGSLDELANRLLWPDRPLVRHPLSWVGLRWVEIDLDEGRVVRRGTERNRMVDAERPHAEPPLLRWAAGHLLRRQLTDLTGLGGRASALDSRHGPAVIAGALDAADVLTEDDARRAIAFGLASGRAPVRKVALRVLADRLDRIDAVRRATADPDAQIRRWATELDNEGRDATPGVLF